MCVCVYDMYGVRHIAPSLAIPCSPVVSLRGVQSSSYLLSSRVCPGGKEGGKGGGKEGTGELSETMIEGGYLQRLQSRGSIPRLWRKVVRAERRKEGKK